jgi:hypothetical protein
MPNLFVEMRSYFLPGWLQTEILLISAFWVAGITRMSYNWSKRAFKLRFTDRVVL